MTVTETNNASSQEMPPCDLVVYDKVSSSLKCWKIFPVSTAGSPGASNRRQIYFAYRPDFSSRILISVYAFDRAAL